jgi:hypothetical protein
MKGAYMARFYMLTEEQTRALVEALVKKWTDPDDPDNKLKQRTKRVCLNCGWSYMSDLKVLADPGYCGDPCKEAFRVRVGKLLTRYDLEMEL